MKSIRMMRVARDDAASAIMPIIAVAVKKTGLAKPPTGRSTSTLSSQKPGMMPISVSGMDIMMTSGSRYEPVS